MKQKIRISTTIGVLALLVLTCGVILLGYRVIVTSNEIPGKLGSVSVAANNLQYIEPVLSKVQKVDYETMKYGYMDTMLLAQMDYLDQYYENIRMEEVRAVNNLTAMSEKTADKLAYEAAKAQQEEAEKKAKIAAEMAERAKQAKIQAAAEAIRNSVSGVTNADGNNTFIDVGDDTDTGTGATASKGGKKGTPVYADSHGKSLGKFVITAYCTCRICCGVYSGRNRTASGTVPTTNRTIAVDTSVIPFGTKVVINGQVYVAEDRGGAIKGKRIDMFFYTHKEALRWGRRTMEVFLTE